MAELEIWNKSKYSIPSVHAGLFFPSPTSLCLTIITTLNLSSVSAYVFPRRLDERIQRWLVLRTLHIVAAWVHPQFVQMSVWQRTAVIYKNIWAAAARYKQPGSWLDSGPSYRRHWSIHSMEMLLKLLMILFLSLELISAFDHNIWTESLYKVTGMNWFKSYLPERLCCPTSSSEICVRTISVSIPEPIIEPEDPNQSGKSQTCIMEINL